MYNVQVCVCILNCGYTNANYNHVTKLNFKMSKKLSIENMPLLPLNLNYYVGEYAHFSNTVLRF